MHIVAYIPRAVEPNVPVCNCTELLVGEASHGTEDERGLQAGSLRVLRLWKSGLQALTGRVLRLRN